MMKWISLVVVAGVAGGGGCCSTSSSTSGDAAADVSVTPDIAQPDITQPDAPTDTTRPDVNDASDVSDASDASDVGDAIDVADAGDAPFVPCAPCVGDGCAIVEVTTGARFSCARRANGAVLCWGDNAAGQLGDGTTTSSSRPVPVLGVCDAVEVEAGSGGVCVRRSTGGVSCWGSNISGVLGVGATPEALPFSTRPRDLVGFDGVTAIEGGAGFFCAIRRGGEVWCWGTNLNAQLGIGAMDSYRSSPVMTSGLSDARSVSTSQYGCAARAGGQIVCWGRNLFGRLGTGAGAPEFSATPSPVVGLSDATSIADGVYHACALRMDGTVSCWGDNSRGTLGSTPSPTPTLTPTAVAGVSNVTQIEVGHRHTCALLRDSTVLCWGKNDYGELGRGAASPFEATPAAVMGLSDATQITAHSPHDGAIEAGHTCALRRTGAVVCWGKNDVGQLGDGTTMTRAAPATVAF